MASTTAARNREPLNDGRATLLQLDVADLPDELDGFDRIWAMNVRRYWPDQQAVIDDLARRLNPTFAIVVGHGRGCRTASANGSRTVRARLLDQMTLAGLDADSRIADLSPSVTFVIGRSRRPEMPALADTSRY